MKILVAMANYGTKNVAHAKRLIAEYRSMAFDVDIVVLCESAKDFEQDVNQLIGLPSKDPWSLPFSHRKLFSDNLLRYDLFIYTEDDTLVSEKNIRAFLHASQSLPDDKLPGFVRYELYPDGRKSYPDIHGPFHWVPMSVRREGKYIYAQLSNDHSACYMLTRAQLSRAIASGGFLVPPHSGRYDLLCAAATDPYTQCGFTKVICISHAADFEVHHLSNAYIGRVGLEEDGYKGQVDALFEIADGGRPPNSLLCTETGLGTVAWDKSYYEPYPPEMVRFIPGWAKDILFVGCGWGATEEKLVASGVRVAAIPLDAVMAKRLEMLGVNVLPPDFEESFANIGDAKFDVVVLSEVLQYLPRPVEMLRRFGGLLNERGVIIGSAPNLSPARRMCGRWLLGQEKFRRISRIGVNAKLNLTNFSTVRQWLKSGRLYPTDIRYDEPVSYSDSPLVGALMPKALVTRRVLFAAHRM